MVGGISDRHRVEKKWPEKKNAHRITGAQNINVQ